MKPVWYFFAGICVLLVLEVVGGTLFFRSPPPPGPAAAANFTIVGSISLSPAEKALVKKDKGMLMLTVATKVSAEANRLIQARGYHNPTFPFEMSLPIPIDDAMGKSELVVAYRYCPDATGPEQCVLMGNAPQLFGLAPSRIRVSEVSGGIANLGPLSFQKHFSQSRADACLAPDRLLSGTISGSPEVTKALGGGHAALILLGQPVFWQEGLVAPFAQPATIAGSVLHAQAIDLGTVVNFDIPFPQRTVDTGAEKVILASTRHILIPYLASCNAGESINDCVAAAVPAIAGVSQNRKVFPLTTKDNLVPFCGMKGLQLEAVMAKDGAIPPW